MFLGGIHGTDRATVYAELCQAVDEHLAIAAADGTPPPAPLAIKTFSGKFILRTLPEQHLLLALRALQVGDSLNGFVVERLELSR